MQGLKKARSSNTFLNRFGLAVVQAFVVSLLMQELVTQEDTLPSNILIASAASAHLPMSLSVVSPISKLMLMVSMLGFSGLALVLAHGLFHHRRWAWSGTLLVQMFGGIVSVMGLLAGSALTLNGVRLAIATLVTTYLLQPEVRQSFGMAGNQHK